MYYIHGTLITSYKSILFYRFPDDENKKNVESIVRYLKDAFKHSIRPAFPWMDEPTVLAAIEKVEAMEIDIAYPVELLNSTTVDSFYEGNFN